MEEEKSRQSINNLNTRAVTRIQNTGKMKTAYELAMERLNKTSPAIKLSERQKKELAELDSKYAAKIAERELAVKDKITAAASAGEFEKVEQLRQEFVAERKKLQDELESKKDQVRNADKK